MLEEVHAMTARIEKLSQAEHDLISDVHPQVNEIKEQVKTSGKLFRPKRAEFPATRTAIRRCLDW